MTPPITTNRLVRRLHQLTGWNRAPTATLQAPRRDFLLPLNALAASAHWDRVIAVVQVSFARVDAVTNAHALARQQLDVADYTLQTLLDELRTVMPGAFPAP